MPPSATRAIRISRSTDRRATTASRSFRACRSSTSSRRDFCAKGDARHLRVVLDGDADGLDLHNFYVPAGGDEPDPEINVKFAHKLAFVDEMVDWAARREAGGAPVDPGRRSQHRSARARRLEPQGAPQGGQPHADRGREIEAGPGRRVRGSTRCASSCPTIRSSTLGGATARRIGRRPTRAGASTTSGSARRSRRRSSRCEVLREARGWERPSDHAPVKATFSL